MSAHLADPSSCSLAPVVWWCVVVCVFARKGQREREQETVARVLRTCACVRARALVAHQKQGEHTSNSDRHVKREMSFGSASRRLPLTSIHVRSGTAP